MKNKKAIRLNNNRKLILNTAEVTQHDQITKIGKALSSSIRLQMLNILDNTPLSLQEIAGMLDIPLSSTAMHIHCLEEARMVVTESQPGIRGSMRVCINSVESIHIDASTPYMNTLNQTITLDMPIGNYYSCHVEPECGLADASGILDMADHASSFYSPQRTSAQLIWFQKGYIEYRFPNYCKSPLQLQELSFSLEICSEAPGYAEDWPSDITFFVNDKEVFTYRSPGDFGSRRGNLTPKTWGNGRTQYGILKTISIRPTGCYLDGKLKNQNVTLDTLSISQYPYLSFKACIKDDALHIGGINLFGKEFGDYPQGIIMTMVY